jgi:hypothetical protein
MTQINYAKGGEGGNWQPLPEGTYDVRITKCEQSASTKGNPQLRITAEVLDGTHQGKVVNLWYSLLPQSTWKMDKLLEALEIERTDTGEFNADGTPIMGFDDDHLIGRCVCYTVTQREYPVGSKKMTNDFNDEARSEYDDDEGADAPAPAAPPQTQAKAPAAAAAPAAQQVLPGTDNPAMRRRPRPASVPQ